jgi:hypothetical protein
MFDTTGGGVQPANNATTVVGVVVGTGKGDINFGDVGPFDPDNLMQQYLAYDEPGYVWIIPPEFLTFEAQTAAVLPLVPGNFVDYNLAADTEHGNRDTGQSTVELVTSAQNSLYTVQAVESPDNDTSLVNARWQVQFATPAI